MHSYSHLTLDERERLQYFLALGYSITKIAQLLWRNKSTISRELKRNLTNEIYLPSRADEKYKARRKKCKPKYKLANVKIFQLVAEKFLVYRWSPEQIAGRLQREENDIQISYQTIYRGIYKGLFNGLISEKGHKKATRCLRHRGKKRHYKKEDGENRGKIRISHDITERPEICSKRERIGDFEIDTVIGKKGGVCLITSVDKASNFLVCRKSEKKDAASVARAFISSHEGIPCLTFTADRGKEFALHEEIAKALGIEIYFAHPHSPWERGTNENTNGLLREYFPKGKDMKNLTDEYVAEKVLELNLRPRKRLNYQTPFEVFFGNSVARTK